MEALQKVFDILQCTICFSHFKLYTHEPYVLTCGHTVCQKSIKELYKNQQIKCPICKEINEYASFDKISRNIMIRKVLEEMLNSKNDTINKMEDQLEQFNNVISKIKLENKLIEDYVKQIIEMSQKIRKFNIRMIWQMQAYQKLTFQNLYSISFKGVQQEEINKVQADLQKFSENFKKADQFIKQQDLQINTLKENMAEVQNYQIVDDYALFKTNLLNYIDYGHWKSSFNFIISMKNFKDIINIIEQQRETDIDDLVMFAFMNQYGIGIEKNIELSKKVLKSKLIEKNGRALFLKYVIGGQTQHYLLAQSSYLGYDRSITESAFHLKDLTKDEKKVIIYSASSRFGCSLGMNNLGVKLSNDDGIQKDKKASIKYYLKSLQKGFLNKDSKQEIDAYYEQSEQFRTSHPNYKKWNRSYEEFEQQDILLL